MRLLELFSYYVSGFDCFNHHIGLCQINLFKKIAVFAQGKGSGGCFEGFGLFDGYLTFLDACSSNQLDKKGDSFLFSCSLFFILSTSAGIKKENSKNLVRFNDPRYQTNQSKGDRIKLNKKGGLLLQF